MTTYSNHTFLLLQVMEMFQHVILLVYDPHHCLSLNSYFSLLLEYWLSCAITVVSLGLNSRHRRAGPYKVVFCSSWVVKHGSMVTWCSRGAEVVLVESKFWQCRALRIPANIVSNMRWNQCLKTSICNIDGFLS